ncbi:MAG: hypothetical protein QOC97_638, partial [Chloroflexota bacterium]|nr:hypothetical protein [Chloroflexota bacterium]
MSDEAPIPRRRPEVTVEPTWLIEATYA